MAKSMAIGGALLALVLALVVAAAWGLARPSAAEQAAATLVEHDAAGLVQTFAAKLKDGRSALAVARYGKADTWDVIYVCPAPAVAAIEAGVPLCRAPAAQPPAPESVPAPAESAAPPAK